MKCINERFCCEKPPSILGEFELKVKVLPRLVYRVNHYWNHKKTLSLSTLTIHYYYY